ncbi:unnamed protein product [Medioppia subpectinata]|uniref:RRM domain-containing protein n=1 Tax=Medioppia subpectinata TaxID=1979941 RepID=A0A7R9KVS1_9ACAR|nr:unnamed protein product [Medioppia subpectinata]CAG2109405.1 unnamed protein product [Medioppia subpectinata]
MDKSSKGSPPIDRGAVFTANIGFRSAYRKRSNTFPTFSSDSSSFDDHFDSGYFGHDLGHDCRDNDFDWRTPSPKAFITDPSVKSSAIVSARKPQKMSSTGDSPKTPNTPSYSPPLMPLWPDTYSPINHNKSPFSPNMSSPMLTYPMVPMRPPYGLNSWNLLSPLFGNTMNTMSPLFDQSPLHMSQHFNPQNTSDRILESAKQHRNAAAFADARHTWSGTVPTSPAKTPVYSCKVFLGGVPWEMTDHDIKLTFSRFGNVNILRPGQHVRLSRTSQNKDKAGYLYLIFESDKQVKSLLSACIHDFSNGGKYYFALNQTRFRPKDVQIIPWNVNDTTFVRSPTARVDANKTVFVGALHGMLTADGLAAILEDLFGGVVYVGIDTDKYKYPIGSGRVTFSTTKSYARAVQAAFIDVKAARFQKKIQIDPFLEDSNCTHCRTEKGPIFCRDLCMTYLCRTCWDVIHATEGMTGHQPIMRNKSKDYVRELPDPLFTKALFDMMDDGLSVCLADDPAGNAKLMFSILECLPKINRCTVLFLMDHLKKVMGRADRNKMSSQAMAICFGPLFTCHSESENLHKPIEVFKFLLEIWPQRRSSTSRSVSNDSMLSNKAPIVGKHEPSMPVISSHSISSTVQTNPIITTAITSTSTASYSHLPPIAIPSTTISMLPTTAALTPGPSPTALTICESTTGVTVTTTTATSALTGRVIDRGSDMIDESVHQTIAGPPPPTVKKTVAFAQQNNRSVSNNGPPGGAGGVGTAGGTGVAVSGSGSVGQSRALPFPPNC